MIQFLNFLIFMSSFVINCSQKSIPEKKELHQAKPLIIISEDANSFRNSNDFANLSKNINSDTTSNIDEKERSSRLSLSAVTSCLMVAQRRHSKWSSPNSNKRKSVKSSNNNDDSDTHTSPNDSGKIPKILKKASLEKPSSFYSGKDISSEQATSFYSDTDDDPVDYQNECSLSLQKAQQEILASLKPEEKKTEEKTEKDKKRDNLKESLDAFSFPKDEK